MELSAEQKRIINHDRGHLRIIACPGSGKTETISRRVASLVGKGEKPADIVAFTFTVKAAGELKLRIRKILEAEFPEKSDFGDMYVGTIDSFCLYMLKRIRPEYKSFEILDANQRAAFVSRWYLALSLKDLEGEQTGKWNTIGKFCASVDRMITENVDAAKVSDHAFVRCFEAYQEKLREERFFDFVSIIATLLDVVRKDGEARRYLKEHVKHVVFDEYQDVNGLQEDLLEVLSQGARSVCVVGDDDQNIFQWRGSDIRHIREFDAKYARYGISTGALETNYRATKGLISVASRLIANNENRIQKAMRDDAGCKNSFEPGDIMHRHFDTDVQEFGFIAGTITDLRRAAFSGRDGRRRQISYADMAIIVRTNADAARAAKYLDEYNIPYVADSGPGVFKRGVVGLALDCLLYSFGCGGYTIYHVPDMEELEARYDTVVAGGDTRAFVDGLEAVRRRADAILSGGDKDWLGGRGLQEFYHRVLCAMGMESGALSNTDLYALAVLSRIIGDYEYVYRSVRARHVDGLKWFVKMFAESNYGDTTHVDSGLADAVRILTIWKAKGLEFPAVFMPSFESRRSKSPPRLFIDEDLYDYARYRGDTEDMRRAYYVGVTRSQKYLFMTGSARHETGHSRKKPYKPHQFAAEMHGAEFSDIVKIRPAESVPDPPRHTGIIPSSFSDLSLYGRCPHDYMLRHDMGFNVGVPPAFGYGTNIHNILNKIHSDYIRNGRIPTKDDISDMFDEMFYMRFAPGRQGENMKRAGMRVVENYVGVHGSDFGSILETEKRFEFTLGGALISGSIDLLKNMDRDGKVERLEIIDFKTDRRAGYRPDHREQVRLYAEAVRISLGYLPERATIHYLDTQKTEDVDIRAAELERTRGDMIKKIGMIRARRFTPAPEETKCNGCDFQAICPHKGFEVGPDFGPAPRRREWYGGNSATGLAPPVVSDIMRKKAESLVRRGGIVQKPDGTYEVQSSRQDTPYVVSGTRCQCRGFVDSPRRHPGTIPTCSHVEAVKMFRGES